MSPALAAAATASAGSRGEQTLRERLRGWFSVVGVLLVLVVALAAVAYSQQVQRQEIVTRDLFDAITETDTAYIALIDAETGLRGFALTGERRFLDPYEAASERPIGFVDIARDVARVREDPGTTAAAQRAQDLAQAWYDDYAAPLVAQIEARGPESVKDAQVVQGRARFDEVRAAAVAFVDELRGLRADVADELTTWTRLATLVVPVLVGTIVVLGVGTWIALRRWVIEPLEVVGADARAVASGDLLHPVTVRGPGEVATLAADVEQMRTTLVDEMGRTRDAQREVELAHAQLATQAEELRRSNRDLEQFAYVASHDLQEPLRKVASFTQLLQKRYGGKLDERADQYIEFAVDGAKRMQRLIQDLLGFSRVGRVGKELTEVDLTTALAEAVEQQSEAITDAGAVVTHDPLPVVVGEEPLLVQLFANLVANSVKFRHPGRPARVHVYARETDEGWELACEDDGIGIDPPYAERVFVIFQRLHAKDVYEGTGIGLALCKKIVEFHGGRIWIDQPASGIGTRVCWTLPHNRPGELVETAPPDSAQSAAPAADET
ncbi:sensor histidine kinase [Cellulomonas uda]|uniref:histidine kinase n=1 Tax=Cellulomonas uda TaxID=1714 RepID=A0A4Y3K877_CELUD|nr:sensor histidine kinase [Cellulomonas uda]NII67176.1 signal transduction histidine kinase [Cellulomonas uda]GEA80147.1 histidine kinase [Cellulomonas uda]